MGDLKETAKKLEDVFCMMQQAIIHRRNGRVHEPESGYEFGLAVFRSIPNTELEQAECLTNFCLFHRKLGQTSPARLFAQGTVALCNSLLSEATTQISSICHEWLEGAGEA